MDPTESCARCGGDVSYGATYAPDSSLLCGSCATALKAEASLMEASHVRQTAARKAKRRWKLALASAGTLALMIAVYAAVATYLLSLRCAFHPLDIFLGLLEAAGKSF